MENNNEFPIPSLPEQAPAPASMQEKKLKKSNLVNQTEKEMDADLDEMGFTGEEADELKDYLKELDEGTKESFNGEYPFYKTTLGISIISVVALVILLLVLKYTGMFDIMSLF